MPIVIDEVVISVEVTSGAPPAAEGAESGSGGAEGGGGAADKQAIIEECVERVLDVLARREER